MRAHLARTRASGGGSARPGGRGILDLMGGAAVAAVAAAGWVATLVHAWPWIAAGVAAVAAAAWLARRRRRFPVRPAHLRRATPRYPVVLAHGLLGFDEIRVGGARHDYFRGVSARLEKEGCVVHRCRVARTASIADRAAELTAFVRALPAPRVNLVAHSMGGLDARYALARLGLGRRVASLTTVGSPHRGTRLADLGHGLARRAGVGAALARVGMNIDALHDLTTDHMVAFNRAVRDVRGVMYASVVGAPRARSGVTRVLVPTWLWLGGVDLPNDGMVPAGSQRWGDVVFEIEADHFAQIGWSRAFDAAAFYAELLRELRGRGM
jgi:triacylglycerol lipase